MTLTSKDTLTPAFQWAMKVSQSPSGESVQIVSGEGVVALVKAHGKSIGAAPMLAAAPEMLEALKQAAEALQAIYVAHGVDSRSSASLKAVRAAIAKAGGVL